MDFERIIKENSSIKVYFKDFEELQKLLFKNGIFWSDETKLILDCRRSSYYDFFNKIGYILIRVCTHSRRNYFHFDNNINIKTYTFNDRKNKIKKLLE